MESELDDVFFDGESGTLRKLTKHELSLFLQKKGFYEEHCVILAENNVDGNLFLKMTREDLLDLFPNDIPTRKTLWDFLCQVKSKSQLLVNEQNSLQLPRSATSTPSRPSSRASTVSLDESFDEEVVPLSQSLPCALKRTKPRQWESPSAKKEKCSLLGPDFKIPISSEVMTCVRDEIPLDDRLRRQLIRECVTCLQAYAGQHLTSEHVTEASKKLCHDVPILKDVKPPLWPEHVEFQYWASAKHLIRKRISNVKSANKAGMSSSKESGDLVIDLGENGTEDAPKHEKELQKELAKKHINWKAVKQLQMLTFSKRWEKIIQIKSRLAVAEMLDQFPYFQNQKVLQCELELHVSKIKKAKCSYETFVDRWGVVSKCFINEEGADESKKAFLALKQIHEPFEGAEPLLFSLNEGQRMETFLKQLPSSAPYLVFCPSNSDESFEEAQIFAVVERDVLCELCTPAGPCMFQSALVTLLALYYSLNIEYQETQKLIFKFLEEHVLDIIPRRKSYVFKQIENRLLAKLKSC